MLRLSRRRRIKVASSVRSALQRYFGDGCRAAIVAPLVALAGLAGCTRQPAIAPALATTLAPALGGAVDGPESLTLAEFKGFLLNALLIPLLDDDTPSRWVDPWFVTTSSIALACNGARVSVDGKPLAAGDRVPPIAFTLRWEMDRCSALNEAVWLSGAVELLVFHDGDSYSASVRPEMLRVVSGVGDEVLRKPFSATTPLHGPAPR